MKKILTFALLMFVFTILASFRAENSFAEDLIAQLGTPLVTPKVNLVIKYSGTGQGNITTNPIGIKCSKLLTPGTACLSFNSGIKVTLTAKPAQYNSFAGWGGSCQGTGASCGLILLKDTYVTATFNPPPKVGLTVTKQGGPGAVSSSPAGINCDPNCPSSTASFTQGTTVSLTATAVDCRSNFSGWGGSCSGTGGCTITMSQTQPVQVTAAFEALASAYGPDRQIINPTCDRCYYCTAPNLATSLKCKLGTAPWEGRLIDSQGRVIDVHDCNAIAIWCRENGYPSSGPCSN
jgi:hypothetical protein